MTEFDERVLAAKGAFLEPAGLRNLQVNMGYLCCNACSHCHLGAGPARPEIMDRDVVDSVLGILREYPIETLDITGGAPELNPHFRYLVREAQALGKHTIVRSNLTVFHEPGMEDLPAFYAETEVDIIASLPCYTEGIVDGVRGAGVYWKSIEALKELNAAGYGLAPAGKRLHLVYNPVGAYLPPSQCGLESAFRKELLSAYNIVFTGLYTFANMPIGRFGNFLNETGVYDQYMNKVKEAFNPGALDGLMCRRLLSVGWDGTLYDCDFNQAMGLTVDIESIRDIGQFDYEALCRRKIVTGDHCFVCAAGQGFT